MCGRFNVETAPLTRLLLELVGLAHPGPDNHNAAPTESICVVRLGAGGEPEIARMRWWLTPHWAKEVSTRYSMFNAKAETVASSPAFREPYRRRRCLVPISGFYEWTGVAPRKVASYIRPHAAPGLLLAGIWDHWQDPDGTTLLDSFAVITTDAHPALRFVHHRQPVLLGDAGAHAWLDATTDPATLARLLQPGVPVDLDVVPVSGHVNNARHKDSRCLEPIGTATAVPADPLDPADRPDPAR
ncbi:MAG: SOS response-associated peptidase [Pseudomonadales bacterium]|nr:SOS response-associated peptidase [Pseudomonadales bacterium]